MDGNFLISTNIGYFSYKWDSLKFFKIVRTIRNDSVLYLGDVFEICALNFMEELYSQNGIL